MERICAIVKDNFFYIKRQEELTPDFSVVPHAPVLALSALRAKDVYGGAAYCSVLCCDECMKALGMAGIKKVVYKEDRKDGNEATLQVAEYYDIEVVKNELIEVS